MMPVGQCHQVIMMNAIHDRGLQRLNDEMAGRTLKKAGNGQKKLFVHGDPFGYFLIIFIVKNSCYSFFNKINIVGNDIFPEQEMIFGDRPFFPGG